MILTREPRLIGPRKDRLARRFGLGVCLLFLLSPALGWAQAVYSEATLEAFVSAAIEVRALADKWTPAIESAGSEAEAQALKDQATSEMAEIITRTDGITVAEYMEINKAAAGNSELMGRIEEIYESRKAPTTQ